MTPRKFLVHCHATYKHEISGDESSSDALYVREVRRMHKLSEKFCSCQYEKGTIDVISRRPLVLFLFCIVDCVSF